MSNISQWSTTAGSNNSPAPDGAPEGMSPPGLNDVIRENMAAAAKVYLDQKGTATTGGTTTAYTLTTSNAHAALGDISLFSFQVNAANTGAATLAVDGLTAKAMQLNGAALAAGDLRTDEIVIAVYNPDNDVFDVFKSGSKTSDSLTDLTLTGGLYVGGTAAANYLDDYEEGTFTPTYTASTPPTVGYSSQDGKYTKFGDTVLWWIRIETNSVSGGSGSVRIGGLPFTAASGSYSANVSESYVFADDYPTGARVAGGGSEAFLYYRAASNSTSANLEVSDLATGGSSNLLIASGSYKV